MLHQLAAVAYLPHIHFWVWQIQAHRSPLAAMAVSGDGLFLATASQQGTVIRVHCIPQASKVFIANI
jgi:hypothetical protein